MGTRITKTAAVALPLGKSMTDGEITGLEIRKSKRSGVTVGQFRYRFGGKQRYLRLGELGPLSVDQLRALAKQAAYAVAQGRDPAGERDAQQAEAQDIVAVVCETYLRRRNPRTADEIRRCFERHVFPRFGNWSVHSLTKRDLIRMVDEVADSHGRVMADRTYQYTAAALRWWEAGEWRSGFHGSDRERVAAGRNDNRARADARLG
jgi:hypothetical protein